MTDPLIIVEGNLRLQPTRWLADPHLKFGSEWSSTRNRPAQSNTEVPLYAVRLETAYVGSGFAIQPGLAVSRAEHLGRVRQRSDASVDVAAHAKPEPPTTPPTTSPTIPQSSRSRPCDPVPAPSHASHCWPRSMKTAIALACAGLIAWLIFGQEHRVGEKSPVTVKPDSEPGLASTSAAGSSVAAATVAAQPVAVAVAPVVATPVASQPAALPPPVAVPVKPVAASANSGTVADKTTNDVSVARV